MNNSFILYTDMGLSIQSLRDAEAGKLLKAIYQYVATGELPEGLKSPTAMCFALIRRSLDRDLAKYEEVCRRRAEAGRAGGLRTQELFRQKEANASNASANQAYHYSENDSEYENENGSVNNPVPGPPAAGADSTPPPFSTGNTGILLSPRRNTKPSGRNSRRTLRHGWNGSANTQPPAAKNTHRLWRP